MGVCAVLGTEPRAFGMLGSLRKKGHWKPHKSLSTRVPAHADARKMASAVNWFLLPSVEENNFLTCSSLDADIQNDSNSPNSAVKIAGTRDECAISALQHVVEPFLRAGAGAGVQC